MELSQLKQAIEVLPPDAQTKPILIGLVTAMESSLSSLARHQQDVQEAKAFQMPPHPYGPCNNPQCQSCVQAAQEAVMFGRQSFMGDLDSALAWSNRPDIAEIVVDIYGAWEQAGKPQ